MSIMAMVEEIRNEYAKTLEIEQAEAANRFEDYASGLLMHTYQQLREKVYRSCGIGPKIWLYLSYNPLSWVKSPKGLCRRANELSGLNLAPDSESNEYIMVNLEKGQPRFCEVLQPEDHNNLVELDFPSLIEENTNRRELWQTFLPGFAERSIDTIHQCLDILPDKHYGIPRELTIVDEKGCTPFSGEFQFYNVKIKYGELTSTHREELQSAINSRLGHAEIEISGADSCLWLSIKRAPNKSLEDDTYFDYESFYAPYDEVTPELRSFFKEISENLVIIPATDQISNLKPVPKIIHWFKDSSPLRYADMQKRFVGQVHAKSLMQYLSEQLGVEINGFTLEHRERNWASPRGCAHGTYSYDERIEFFYNDMDHSTHPLIVEQRRISDNIQHIKTQDVSYFATRLAYLILQKTKASDITSLCQDRDSRTHHLSLEDLRVKLYINGAEFQVDLFEVKDDDFKSKIEAEVARQTDGLVNLSLIVRQYELIFN